jgi:putative FmdB family regulatory protein
MSMPIYEFYCSDCHRIFSFLSRSVNTKKQPACPRCGRSGLTRRVSSFAISKGRKEEPARPVEPELPGLPPGMDEARLEQAMATLSREAEGMNEEDPRQGAQLMRRLFEATGMPVGAGMEEALRRMESGEDPEKIEEEMGDVMEDPLAPEGGADPSGDGPRKALRGLRRRVLPPSVDPELHEM